MTFPEPAELGRFPDRREAGRQLARLLAPKLDAESSVVLALPRGGVPVGREIADQIGAPLEVLLVRKLGVPWQPELAFGAIAEDGGTVLDDAVVRELRLGQDEIDEVVERERRELDRRRELYRRGHPLPDVRGKTAVVVDDGIATGSTVRAALGALRHLGAKRIIVACPVAPPETVEALFEEADDVECLRAPPALGAIGFWYDDFRPVADTEVLRLLGRPRQPTGT